MEPTSTKSFLKNIPWKYLIPTFLLGAMLSFIVLRSNVQALAAAKKEAQMVRPSFAVCRSKEFKNIKPLATERNMEAVEFTPLKTDLQQLVESLKKDGTITQASVYIREFDHREWTSVNNEEPYHPASMLKVPLMMCYLRMAEADPGLLKQTLVYDETRDPVEVTTQYYKTPSIESLRKYTIAELLYHMIVYSDNKATHLLASNFDFGMLKKLFSDFCLPEPVVDPNNLNFKLTAQECGVFFKAIYTASYLSPEYSEYAADLLSKSSFQEGFVKGFPANIHMWHKFGEWKKQGYDSELHEGGLVFINEKPYLLVIMTKGKDTEKLAEAIRLLSERVYNQLFLFS